MTQTDVTHPEAHESFGMSPRELIHQRQNYLLQRIDWHSLMQSYLRGPLVITDANRGLLVDFPYIVNRVVGRDFQDDTLAGVNADLDTIRDEMLSSGYLLERHREPRRRRPSETDDLVDQIDSWLTHTRHSRLYFRGERHDRAQKFLPEDVLRDVKMTALVGRRSMATGQLPWVLEAPLRDVFSDVVTDYDEGIEAQYFRGYNDINVHGAEHMQKYGVSAEEFARIIDTAQLSYPAELMRGLERIDIIDKAETMIEGGKVMSYLGEVDHDNKLMKLWPPNIHTAALEKKPPHRPARDAFIQRLEAVIDHEFAHVAHFNAPIEWLRNWEKLCATKAISISEYSDHAGAHRSDGGRVEFFAECVSEYREDPMRLMNMSPEHFMMLEELLGFYDWKSTERARELAQNGVPPSRPEYAEAVRMLTQSRQDKLHDRLRSAHRQGSPLGRVSLASVNTPQPAHHRGGAVGRASIGTPGEPGYR